MSRNFEDPFDYYFRKLFEYLGKVLPRWLYLLILVPTFAFVVIAFLLYWWYGRF